MALNPKSTTGATAPLWLTVGFLLGLAALFLGQRVVVKWETFASVLSGAAVCLLLAVTAARFVPVFRGSASHAAVARVLNLLQLLGVVSVMFYFATTDKGAALLGLGTDAQSHARTVLNVFWVMGIAVSAAGLIFAEFALHPMRGADHLETRRVFAAAASGVTLALGASYGALFVYAAAQEEAQADFSYFKTSQPGEATVKLVQRSGKPIRVTAFFPEVSQVRKEVSGYLSQLQKLAGNLEVKVTDRYLDPTLANELKVVADGVVVLAQDDTTQMLIVGSDIEKARPKLTKFDSEFYGKLGKLVNSRHTAYFTVGHGELNDADEGPGQQEGRTGEVVKKLLESQNYRVKNLGLSEGLANKVPDDADVVLVLGPTLAFAPEEIGTLRRFAEGGGKLFMALDVDTQSTKQVIQRGANPVAAPAPSSAGAATSGAGSATASSAAASAPAPAVGTVAGKEWVAELAAAVGATLVPTVLADEQQYMVRRNDPSDRVILPTNRFSSHASVSTLNQNASRAGVVVLGAAHLLETEQSAGKPLVALRSMPTTFADDNLDYKLDGTEERKAYNLAVALTRPSSKAGKADKPEPSVEVDPEAPEAEGEDGKDKKSPAPDEMRAFVFADADALSDLLMERVPGNQLLVVDAIRWLVGEESLAGELQSEEDVHVEQTKQQELAWFYSLIFGVPALVLGIGVWLSRRARGSSPGGRRAPQSGAGVQA